MIEIDGSIGEAGGQVLRTALGLSSLLNKPFRIFNIRKGRRKPGLMPQHLMCIHALKQISDARVKGDSIDSMELLFEPDKVKAGVYNFDIGTAGSTSLLLQAILLPLIYTSGSSTISITGGTHVPFSPPFEYIRNVFIPTLSKIGIKLNAEVESYGFYPKGGGRIKVEILPSDNIKPISLLKRGEIRMIRGISGVANLPVSIAERQREAVLKMLDPEGFNIEIRVLSATSPGKGTFVFLKAETDKCVAGFSSLGERGKRAEKVGGEAARGFLNYKDTNSCLDPHIADQIVPYLAIAHGESSFTTSCITNHLLTNPMVVKRFADIDYIIEGELGSAGKIIINGVKVLK